MPGESGTGRSLFTRGRLVQLLYDGIRQPLVDGVLWVRAERVGGMSGGASVDAHGSY